MLGAAPPSPEVRRRGHHSFKPSLGQTAILGIISSTGNGGGLPQGRGGHWALGHTENAQLQWALLSRGCSVVPATVPTAEGGTGHKPVLCFPCPLPPQLAAPPPNAVGSRHRLPVAKLVASGLQSEMAWMLVGVWQGRPSGQVSRLLPREEAGAALSMVSRTVSPCACPWDLVTSSHRGPGGPIEAPCWGAGAPMRPPH